VFNTFFDLPQTLDRVAEESHFDPMPPGFPYRIPAWADDTAVICKNEKEVQLLLDECERWGLANGLTFNAKKTVALVLGKKKPPECMLKLDNVPIVYSTHVTHLGVELTSHSRIKSKVDLDNEKWFQGKLRAIQSLLLARPYGLEAMLSLKLVKTSILPSLLYGSEIVLPSEEPQKLLNKALRVILSAYQRTHRSYMHFFTGMWRIQAYASYRMLSMVARWHCPTEGSRIPREAFQMAMKEGLPFYLRFTQVLSQFKLEGEWEYFRQRLLGCHPSDMKRVTKEWKRKASKVIDEEEARWNRSELIFECKLPLRTTPHPCMYSPLANFGFMVLADHFAPPDVVEAQEGILAPCSICGEKEGDRYSHLLWECDDEEVSKLREMNTVVHEFAKAEVFVNLERQETRKEERVRGKKELEDRRLDEDGGMMKKKEKKKIKEEGCPSRLKITEKKLRMLMTYLRDMYKLKMKAVRGESWIEDDS
jgi:hypothetical protein